MGIEIERKFLVIDDGWKAAETSSHAVRQAYLCTGPPTAVRVRIKDQNAILNIKHAILDIERAEFEYPIPLNDAESMMSLALGVPIVKTRHIVYYENWLWEVDVFEGDNEGLIVAEIELPARDSTFPMPPWAGKEVSCDPRYLNTSLSLAPYQSWPR